MEGVCCSLHLAVVALQLQLIFEIGHGALEVSNLLLVVLQLMEPRSI